MPSHKVLEGMGSSPEEREQPEPESVGRAGDGKRSATPTGSGVAAVVATLAAGQPEPGTEVAKIGEIARNRVGTEDGPMMQAPTARGLTAELEKGRRDWRERLTGRDGGASKWAAWAAAGAEKPCRKILEDRRLSAWLGGIIRRTNEFNPPCVAGKKQRHCPLPRTQISGERFGVSAKDVILDSLWPVLGPTCLGQCVWRNMKTTRIVSKEWQPQPGLTMRESWVTEDDGKQSDWPIRLLWMVAGGCAAGFVLMIDALLFG